MSATVEAQGWKQIGELGLAFVLSSLIGLEREWRQKSAGLRTHTLVGVGAALFLIISKYGFSDVLGKHVILDPSRVAAQVVTGIGFIGAGAIMRQGTMTYGTATAASIWNVGIIGGAVGYGYFDIGIILAVANIVVLRYLARFKRKRQQERDHD